MSLHSTEQLKEENRVLKDEIERLEELLSASRAERDQIGLRYNAISERLEALLKKERGDVSSDEAGRQSLVQQNIELRRKLEEEHSNYKRKLQFYQDGQARQGQLVQKLQAKVLHYKNRCAELEEQLRLSQGDNDHTHKTTIKLTSTQEKFESESDKAHRRLGLDQTDLGGIDTDATVIQLEGAEDRIEHLTRINELLREQLDNATAANKSAIADLHKLVHVRDELLAREAEWKKEEQSFNEHYAHMHNHLLELWQTICTFRREFNNMKLASEHELAHLSSEFRNDTQNIVTQLRNHKEHNQSSADKERSERSTLERKLADKIRELTDLQAKYDAHSMDLNARNSELNAQNDRLRRQMQTTEKERLTQSIGENNGATSRQLYAKIDRLTERNALYESLRHIAHDLLDKCDQVDVTLKQKGDPSRRQSKDDSSTSFEVSSSIIRSRAVSHSPLRARARSPSPNVDETVGTVKRALQRSRQQIVDLSSRLTTYQTENMSLQKQLDELIGERQRLEALQRNLQEQRDRLSSTNQESQSHLEHIKRLLEAAGSEKERLDQNRQKLLEKIDNLNIEIQRLKTTSSDLQRQRDDLESDKEDMSKDLERQIKEVERCRRLLEQSEEKFSRVKEELVMTKEALNAALFRKDMAEQEKEEAVGALEKAESRRKELELAVNKAKAEEASLRDALAKNQLLIKSMTEEKVELSQSLSLLESEKKALTSKMAGLEQEIHGLRSELVTVEREKSEVESQKSAISQSLKLAEKAQRDLEEELRGSNRERKDLIEQRNAWNRQKISLAEEIQDARNEIKRLLGENEQNGVEKERLIKDRAELSVKINSLEKIIQQQNEVLSVMKVDMDNLQANLFDLQQLNSQLEMQRQTLETERQELIVKRDQTQVMLSQSRKELEFTLEKLGKLEADWKSIQQQLMLRDQEHDEQLRRERLRSEEQVKQHVRDSEQRITNLQSELEFLKHQFSVEKKDLTEAHDEQINELNREIENIQRDYDEQLIIINNDRQQELADSERERSLLQEKFLAVQQELKDVIASHEHQKREWMRQQEQLQTLIGTHQDEAKKLKIQLDEYLTRFEIESEELKNLKDVINDLQSQKESAFNEIAELRLQLKNAEESRDSLKHEMIGLGRRLQEAEEAKDLAERETATLKRAVEQELFEKGAAQKASSDLRNMVKKAEAEKVEHFRTIQELKQRINVLEEEKSGAEKEAEKLRASLRESEQTQLELKRVRQDLNRLMQQYENERSRLVQDSNNLQGQLSRSQENEEELRKENFSLKQKVVEMEGRLDSAVKEMANLRRKLTSAEDDASLREKDFKRALEESRLNEKSAADQGKHLEKILDSANSTIAGLRLKLSEADGKIKGLNEHLAWVEKGKHTTEVKLNGVALCLQQMLGLSAVGAQRSRMSRSPSPPPVGAFSKSSVTRTKSASLSRGRSVSPSLMKVSDVNPELIRSALQNIFLRLEKTEHEKNESVSSVRTLKDRLQEVEHENQRSIQRVQQLQKTLSETEEVKRDLESQILTIQNLKTVHEEAVGQFNREKNQLSEEITRLQRCLSVAEQDKQHLQGIKDMLKSFEAKAESEKRALRLSLEEAEGRSAKLEVELDTLDGENERLKVIIGDKETENRSLFNGHNALTQQIRNLEEKIQVLEESNMKLNQIIEKTQAELDFSRNELLSKNALVQERLAGFANLQEHLVHLQRTLDASEQDRRIMQERLENARLAFAESKKQNHSLLEKIQELENKIMSSELHKMEVESQSKQNLLIIQKKEELEKELLEKIQKLQGEKSHSEECLSALQRNQANFEREKLLADNSNKLLEKDKASLIMALEKTVELERLGKSRQCEECLSLDRRLKHLDEDNAELRRQLQALHAQLDQAEQEYEQKLEDLMARQHDDKDLEISRLQSQMQKTVEDLNRTHRHRISSLENQILMLRRELELEIKKREQYISHGLPSDDDDATKDLLSDFGREKPFAEQNQKFSSFRSKQSGTKYKSRTVVSPTMLHKDSSSDLEISSPRSSSFRRLPKAAEKVLRNK